MRFDANLKGDQALDILIHQFDDASAKAFVYQAMTPEERPLFEKMHQAGIQFTPEQLSILFFQGRRTGKTTLIALRLVKEALSLKKGETQVFIVKDHIERMDAHLMLRRIFISLLNRLKTFRIRRNKNVVTVTAL